MDVGLLDHYNILTRKLDETVRFYERALGMRSGPRPPFDVPGAWLYRGDHPVVHVIDMTLLHIKVMDSLEESEDVDGRDAQADAHEVSHD
ncbi:VOC family protein, partial [Croceicoccus naphthovorans]|uniref:VOC family protein n=2 Tax=Croceicoccus naphthovorans TaxID=1348774 RepID=UPI00183A33BA|nr:catechol 2,3-dioxygenase-like lactoylglutathione lyase family enzyme [Croceicoccus naphthovorans]